MTEWNHFIKTARHRKQVTLLCVYHVAARFSLLPAQRIRRTEPEATEQYQRFWQDSHGTRFRQREVRHSLLRSCPGRHRRTNRCVQSNRLLMSDTTHTNTTTFCVFLPTWHLAMRHDISFKAMATTPRRQLLRQTAMNQMVRPRSGYYIAMDAAL